MVREDDGYNYPLRLVVRVSERTIGKHGRRRLVPEIELEGWWASLQGFPSSSRLPQSPPPTPSA